jgi:hypothetical protein
MVQRAVEAHRLRLRTDRALDRLEALDAEPPPASTTPIVPDGLTLRVAARWAAADERRAAALRVALALTARRERMDARDD